MIISKVDSATQLVADKMALVGKLMSTPQGTSEARYEAERLRTQLSREGRCVYCGCEVNKSNIYDRHAGACRCCGAVLDRMLRNKSVIVRGTGTMDTVSQLLEDYARLGFVPYALRGVTGDLRVIVDALRAVQEAEAVRKYEEKASMRRIVEDHLEAESKQRILDMLVQLGADPDDAATQRQVDEIYFSTYG